MSAFDTSKIEEEQPIPRNPNDRTKIWSWIELVREDGEWKFKKTTHIRSFDMILRRWVEHPEDDQVEYLSLQSRGVKKVQRAKILVARSVPDPTTFETLRAFFLFELEARVPDAPEYEHIYLTTTPYQKNGRNEVRGTIVLNYLNFDSAHIMPWNHHWCKVVGKPVKLTDEEAQKMVEAGEIADVLEKVPKVGEQIKTCVYRESL